MRRLAACTTAAAAAPPAMLNIGPALLAASGEAQQDDAPQRAISEECKGFVEKSQNVGRFFREGRAGGWREHLAAAQASPLVRQHWATVAAFG